MEIVLQRYHGDEDGTLGVLFEPSGLRPDLLAYTVEDAAREVKIRKETCIPLGRYRITLRTEGGFHGRYAHLFPTIHRGMLWIRDVPGFEWILIHVGNHVGNTEGCVLVGAQPNRIGADEFVSTSRETYVKIYPALAAAAERDDLWITVRAA